ncbi:DUF2852 domain-containing protein [Roseivivax isoporae]|uniref:DUF2852 domain-containing protein n=1 Tax=Roseivivax isoporae LMG 25204 TaxID=1449351 RepID=X7F5Y9_9RHOB|nr:DUF2852 domain-containing protein [Roseivivax isoporae]ETX28342.1 hypothetical protein RISW2_08580 [Roseivivax isoporae LMG 25204]
MTTANPATLPANAGWFARAEAWLDDKGRGAWIAAMVLGFILFWPVGLALLAYMIWSKRMFSCRKSTAARMPAGFRTMKSSGNAAFDAYKAETLRRLEEEQENFESFLRRLREARDKAEFDQFMEDRSRAGRSEDSSARTADTGNA